MKRAFAKELLKEWGLPWKAMHRNPLQDEVIESTRWSEHHALVFMAPDDFKIWQVEYQKGLTELQYQDLWDGEDPNINPDGTVEGTEVRPIEKIVTIYVPVED